MYTKIEVKNSSTHRNPQMSSLSFSTSFTLRFLNEKKSPPSCTVSLIPDSNRFDAGSVKTNFLLSRLLLFTDVFID